MIIICPQCESRYEIGAVSLPEGGRAVRCTRCRAEWMAFPGPDEDAAHQSWMAADRGDLDLAPRPGRGPADAPEVTAIATPSPPPAAVEGGAARLSPRLARKPGRSLRMAKPRTGRAFKITLVAALACSAWLCVTRREAIVRAWPQAAGLYARAGLPVNLRGLAFEDVSTTGATEAGLPVLVVEGSLRNVTGAPVGVPRLRFAVRDDKEVELYSWTAVAGRNELASGGVLPFKTRLASPPHGGQSVAVRFVRRDDMVATAK